MVTRSSHYKQTCVQEHCPGETGLPSSVFQAIHENVSSTTFQSPVLITYPVWVYQKGNDAFSIWKGWIISRTPSLIAVAHATPPYKLLKKSLETQVWLMISLLLSFFLIIIDIIQKLVQLPFHWYHICNGYEIMETTLRLVLAESQKWNLAKHCVINIVQIRWRMNTMADSLLGNANESQDLISDPHSYQVVLYSP